MVLRNMLRLFIRKQLTAVANKGSANEARLKMSTVDPKELATFGSVDDGWSPNGPMGALLTYNEVRVPYIRNGILKDRNIHAFDAEKPLKELRLLDIGCGIVLSIYLSEPLARLGAKVVALDPCEEMIYQAKEHLKLDPSLEGKIEYQVASIEDYRDTTPERFDAVIASEVLDHVLNPDYFVKLCSDLTLPGGTIVISTINKTWKAWWFMIVYLEYIKRVLPKNTHEYHKFIHPDTVTKLLTQNNCRVVDIQGFMRTVNEKKWRPVDNQHVYYTIRAVKNNIINE